MRNRWIVQHSIHIESFAGIANGDASPPIRLLERDFRLERSGMFDDIIKRFLDHLEQALLGLDRQARRSLLVAFSGGVDSAFLLRVGLDALGDRCHAVTAVSPTMARSEVADARALGVELGLADRHHLVEANELEVPGYADNPVDRFAERFKRELPVLKERGLAHYHAWAFTTVRQLGAAFELAAAHLR